MPFNAIVFLQSDFLVLQNNDFISHLLFDIISSQSDFERFLTEIEPILNSYLIYGQICKHCLVEQMMGH